MSKNNQPITSFIEDGIESLTVKDKLDILCSSNPINCIIKKVNCLNPAHHNIFLMDINSPIVEIFDGEKIIQVDTDIALCMMADTKVKDVQTIVNQLKKYLKKSFVTKICAYLNGGCNIEPFFRTNDCEYEDILKKGTSIVDIRL